MAERIEINDPQVKILVEKVIADLEGFYPDKTVESLDTLHKGLSNRIGRIWKLAGYASRDAFLAAYGFTVVKRSPSGRPVTVDPEALLNELAKRYEGREKPDSVGLLFHDNPDMKGPLKTLQNKAPEVFGCTLARELASRGLLRDEAKRPGGVSDTELQTMLDALATKYAHTARQPSSIEQLKAENPEYAAEIAALVSRSRSLYNTTPKKKLVELGIIASKVDSDQLEATINELGEKLCDIPNGEKPQTVDELAQRMPDLGTLIASSIKQRLVTKKTLQELGILSPTAAAVHTAGIRRIKPDELAKKYRETGLPTLIKPDDANVGLLPTGICGIDVDFATELRRALVMFELPDKTDVSVGDAFQLSVETFYNEWGYESHRFHVTTGTMTLTAKYGPHWVFCKDCLDETESFLFPYVGAKAVKVSQHGDIRVAQIELTWLAALQSNTLAGVLRASGIVRDPDLLGGFGWRFRIWQIENGLRTVDELKGESGEQLKPKAVAKKSEVTKSVAGDKTSPAKKSATTSKKEEQDDKATGPSKKTSAKQSLEMADESAAAQKTKQAKVDAATEKGEPAKKEEAKKGSTVKKAPAHTGKSTPAPKTEKDKPKATKKKSAKSLDSTADATTPKKANGGAVRALKQSAENVVEPTPAKKTLGQVLAQVHESVEQEIAKGAPGTSGLEVARESRAAVVSAGGDGSPFDAIIKELERQEASGMTFPPRRLGSGELAEDKPLGQVIKLLQAEGGGLSKGTVIDKFGSDAVRSVVADSAIVESNGRLYLWCQRDKQGRPMRDFKPEIDSLKERLDKARKEAPAWTPVEQARLDEAATAQIEAQRQLDNAGFFQFSKKKELKARIEELGTERRTLEKTRQSKVELDRLQDKLEKVKSEAKRTLEEHGLL